MISIAVGVFLGFLLICGFIAFIAVIASCPDFFIGGGIVIVIILITLYYSSQLGG